jgi:hypothetical protein
MSLKDYIEQNLFSENLLPKFPFLKAGWTAHVVDCGGCLDEPDFKLLKMCIDQFTQDASIKYCLTTFYTADGSWVSEWETDCTWEEFENSIDEKSAFSYSGMYFFGSSERWGGISVDGELIILGGEANFMSQFEELSGSYLTLKARFDKKCLRKTYAFYESFLMNLRKTFYPR